MPVTPREAGATPRLHRTAEDRLGYRKLGQRTESGAPRRRDHASRFLIGRRLYTDSLVFVDSQLASLAGSSFHYRILPRLVPIARR